MHRKMLQTSVKLVVFRIRGTLEAVHHRASHHCHKVWILSICLLSTSPSWVTEDVDVGSPYCKSMILDRTFTCTGLVELDPLLSGCYFKDILEKIVIPAGSHTDSLREDRGKTISGRSVKCLVPPVILLDAEFRDCGALIVHERHLLFKSKSSEKVFCSLLRCEGTVLIRIGFTA